VEKARIGTVLISVPTGGRTNDLARLLERLTAEYAAREDVQLLVVDNNPDGSAAETFERITGPFGQRRRYVHEPERGYASVRNAVLRNIDGADAVAMIDDDEVPAPGWLDALVEAQGRSDADVIAGPVISEFPKGIPAYYEESGVFAMDAPEYEEGHEMPWCATNNTLMLGRVADLVPEGYDPKFNPMSGEDVHFFMKARLRGARIVWTKTALVHEYLPAARFSGRWLFYRAKRSGNSHALIERELLASRRANVTRFLKAGALVSLGALGWLSGILSKNQAMKLRALYNVGRGLGMLRAFVTSAPWAPPS